MREASKSYGGFASASGSNIMQQNYNYFNGVTREEIMADVDNSQRTMKAQLDAELPSKINKHRFNQSRGVA